MLTNQVLVNEFQLNVSGSDILSEFISTLQNYTTLTSIVQELDAFRTSIKKLDATLGNDITLYTRLVDGIKKMDVPYHQNHLFQTDLYINAKVSILNKKHAYSLKKIIPFLLKLEHFSESTHLEQFKKAFRNRYEEQTIPLALALDVESGLGYIQHHRISDTTPFLSTITPSTSKENRDRHEYSLNQTEKIIFKKLVHAQKINAYTLEFFDSDFENIDFTSEHLPDTLTAFTEIVTMNGEEALILHGMSNHAGKLLGRFASGSQQINEHLQVICKLEQRLAKNKVLAEITHLPEARTGNILKRPHLRAYEIPYLSKSTVSSEQQISLNDLYVSVKHGRIVLSSKKLNKEVIPKLTNAHNYSAKALPVYHFLCDLESQNKYRYLGFQWPKITEEFYFLPRVTYKKTIISKAKWRLPETTKNKIINCHDNDELLKTIQQWKETYNVVDYVSLVEGDNTLLICLKHLESVQLFKNSIKSKKNIQVQEFLGMDGSFIHRENEFFSNECLFTFYNQQKLKEVEYAT